MFLIFVFHSQCDRSLVTICESVNLLTMLLISQAGLITYSVI